MGVLLLFALFIFLSFSSAQSSNVRFHCYFFFFPHGQNFKYCITSEACASQCISFRFQAFLLSSSLIQEVVMFKPGLTYSEWQPTLFPLLQLSTLPEVNAINKCSGSPLQDRTHVPFSSPNQLPTLIPALCLIPACRLWPNFPISRGTAWDRPIFTTYRTDITSLSLVLSFILS